MSSFNRKILAVYVIALLAGAALSGLVYLHGRQVIDVGARLTEHSVPRFDTISQLRYAIFKQKPILYEYYATVDRLAYLPRFEQAQRESWEGLRTLHQMHGSSPELTRIEAEVNRIRQLAVELDKNLGQPGIDWDQARATLAEVSVAERGIAPELDALVQINRKEVMRYGAETRENTLTMIQIVAGFTFVGLILSLFIAYYIRRYLRDAADRKMLAVFPERSPNPMLRLNLDGEILFANDATRILSADLGRIHIQSLLPLDLPQRLLNLQRSPQQHALWEYAVGDRILDCEAHLLSDLQICHLYLADITERKKAEQRLLHQALHDAVTGLPNRRQFRTRLEENLLAHPDACCAVALIRPDRIKLVLESQGYAASDTLIRTMAERLLQALAQTSSATPSTELFRFEGATFGLLVTQLPNAEEGVLLMHRLQAAMTEPLLVEEREFFFTLSIGVAMSPDHGNDAETLFKNAEAAVNRIRTEGGNGFRHYTQDLSDRTEQWLMMEQGLRRAMTREELLLHYQPQVNLHSGEVIGVEALIRWNSPERGLVPPMQFIPLAEETGLIVPIGAWVLRTACRQAKLWLNQGNPLVMAVNISARQFQHPGFIDLIEEVLRETGLPARYLELEITESVAMYDAERTTATLHALRSLGIQLSIDDFGTGFSSLAYLRRFPLDKLKIDQSFVRNLSTDEHDATIAHTVILLGQSLKLTVIAEGVETREQIDILRRLGCQEMQGYYFSRPVPATDINVILREGRRLAA
jgi:diguanylate cyclase (GGDEF)-like protein